MIQLLDDPSPNMYVLGRMTCGHLAIVRFAECQSHETAYCPRCVGPSDLCEVASYDVHIPICECLEEDCPQIHADNGPRKKASQPVVNEKINHPSYYGGDTTYEAIKVIEAWGLNFNRGTALKYQSRAGKKDPSKEVEDLEKSVWYLQREIAILKAKADSPTMGKATD